MKVITFVLVVLCYRSVTAGTIVVPSTTDQRHDESHSVNETADKPQIYKFHVISDIKYRYARTVASTRIANPTNISQEVYFTAVLPETAFISRFLMEVDGQVYNAYVREKEAARQEYTEAVRQGRTAAHVALSARDSNHFRVSFNLEPHKKITFNLTYEELLSRKLGVYKHVINLDPGQIVQDFSVQVNIEESGDIIRLNVPALRTSNQIDANPATEVTNPLATIDRPTTRKVVVKFTPTPEQQRDLARDGIKGQLIVAYDVDRTHHGEILVNDGYFVHFFAPADLPSLKKQVTFVLDVSGSMQGRKIEQLKQAMTTILEDLHPGDLFSIVVFSSFVQVWDHTLTISELRQQLNLLRGRPWDGESVNVHLTPSVIATASSGNITKAKQFIAELQTVGATNIHGALFKALEISKMDLYRNSSNTETNDIQSEVGDQKPEPIIIFLTDGQPNVGISNTNTIVSNITDINTSNTSIFSLALGNDADFNFLKKLSLRNSGFSRKIYEASDTALQLTDFYRQVSSPLLAHVKFVYQPEQVQQTTVTKLTFRRLFSGSELVVAGKILEDNFTAEVQGTSSTGRSIYPFTPIVILNPSIPIPPTAINSTNATSTMERLWAYLTIQQLLDKDKTRSNTNGTSTEKQRALELALRYSFVTPLTSLVVVKPNGTTEADTSQPESVGHQHRSGFNPPVSGYFGMAVPRTMSTLRRGKSAGRQRLVSQPESAQRSVAMRITQPLTQTILTLDDIIWLPLYSTNTTIMLPTGTLGATEHFQLATANQTNEAYTACTTPTGVPGHCRHLRFCVLNVFVTYRSDFTPYFCRINSFAGVCCPDQLIRSPVIW